MKTKPKSFEGALKELEDVVNRLEEAALPLEEALDLFKRGLQLSNCCRDKLKSAEGELQILLKDSAGNFQLNEFDNLEK